MSCECWRLKVLLYMLSYVQVQYRGSDEEQADLLKHYKEFNGDMEQVFDYLMLSRPDVDSHRFREALERAIAAGKTWNDSILC